MKSYIKALNGRCGDFVYYTINNRVYARRYVKPANPGSESQQANRYMFREAMASWTLLSDEEKQSYRRRSRKFSMLGHNLYIREYMKSHISRHNCRKPEDNNYGYKKVHADTYKYMHAVHDSGHSCSDATPYCNIPSLPDAGTCTLHHPGAGGFTRPAY